MKYLKMHMEYAIPRAMIIRCVECDHVLMGDNEEYLYKGKSYCDDCYRAVKKSVTKDST